MWRVQKWRGKRIKWVTLWEFETEQAALHYMQTCQHFHPDTQYRYYCTIARPQAKN